MSETASDAELTFSDISPRWSHKFDQMPLPPLSQNGMSWGLQLLLAETCVIGETYGMLVLTLMNAQSVVLLDMNLSHPS